MIETERNKQHNMTKKRQIPFTYSDYGNFKTNERLVFCLIAS